MHKILPHSSQVVAMLKPVNIINMKLNATDVEILSSIKYWWSWVERVMKAVFIFLEK